MSVLTAALGRYKHTEDLFADPALRLESMPVISRAFAPMVRTQCYDVSEMAIATFLMAREAGSSLVLVPVVMAARFQNGALLRRASDPFGPADLAGKRVGVRAYSQTTGLWLRGDMQESHGIGPADIAWTTFEDAHVPGYTDPHWTQRAAKGADMLAMLRAGLLDAAIFGNDMPEGDDLAPVYPDPVAAGQAFFARHAMMPVNHMVVVRREIADQPNRVRHLMDRLHAAGNPFPSGCAALEPAVRLAVRYAVEQGLLKRPLTSAEIWAGLPAECA